MAKDHGKQIKDDEKYEALRDEGMSKEKAARIANTPNASKRAGKPAIWKSARKTSWPRRPKKLASKDIPSWTKSS